MNNQPKYSYEPKGNDWVVYEWEYCGNIQSGTKVYESSDREQARKECFRLNGWRYKEPAPVKEIIYKSNIHWEHMPGWLKFVVITNINPCLNIPVTDEAGVLNRMRDEITETIRGQKVRVPVRVEVREDEGEMVLLIMRSGRALVSVYVKEKTRNE
ncbi:hypothetical protein [Bacteroides congonensis]